MGIITNIPMSKSILLSFAFMPGDIIKAIIASLIGNILLNHSRFQQLLKQTINRQGVVMELKISMDNIFQQGTIIKMKKIKRST